MKIMDEKLAKKICKILIKICPAFSYSKTTTMVWHGCKCAIADRSCECVQGLKSKCRHVEKWKQLSFLDKINHDLIDSVKTAAK